MVMLTPNVTKSSDLIYSYESMRAAYEAGEARATWEECSSGIDDSPPRFEDFMRQTYNDPRHGEFVVTYRVFGDAKDYEIKFFAPDHETACMLGRNLMDDVEFIYFDVQPRAY